MLSPNAGGAAAGYFTSLFWAFGVAIATTVAGARLIGSKQYLYALFMIFAVPLAAIASWVAVTMAQEPSDKQRYGNGIQVAASIAMIIAGARLMKAKTA